MQGLIKGISLLKLDRSQRVNGHFGDDSFLTIIEEKQTLDNTMHSLQVLCESSKSKLQIAQCYQQSQKDVSN